MVASAALGDIYFALSIIRIECKKMKFIFPLRNFVTSNWCDATLLNGAHRRIRVDSYRHHLFFIVFSFFSFFASSIPPAFYHTTLCCLSASVFFFFFRRRKVFSPTCFSRNFPSGSLRKEFVTRNTHNSHRRLNFFFLRIKIQLIVKKVTEEKKTEIRYLTKRKT